MGGAECELAPDVVFRRGRLVGLGNYQYIDREEKWKRFKALLENKYAATGYIRLWIQGSENERNLKALREILVNPKQLRQWFEQCYEQIIGAE